MTTTPQQQSSSIIAGLTPDQFRKWIETYIAILDDLVSKAESNLREGRPHAPFEFGKMRNTERTLNVLFDIVSPEGEYRSLLLDLKKKRDELADRIASLLERDPESLKRYQEYLEKMKDPRSIGISLEM